MTPRRLADISCEYILYLFDVFGLEKCRSAAIKLPKVTPGHTSKKVAAAPHNVCSVCNYWKEAAVRAAGVSLVSGPGPRAIFKGLAGARGAAPV